MKKLYWIPVIALVSLLGIVVVYKINAAEALERVVRLYEEKYAPERGKDSTDMMLGPGYSELIREKARLSSQLQLAKSDSIGLSLRLRDSVAELLVKGVAVACFPLKEIGVSPLFERLSPESRYELLSEPWEITGTVSTISREPLNVIQAPKDTSEIVPFVVPDTTHAEPVFFTLSTDKGIDLCFYQMDRESKEDRAFHRMIARREAHEQYRLFVDSLVHGGNLPYVPVIKIGMDKVDAKVLYRAMPSRGLVVVAF